jgi:hypothetical protein
MLAWEFKVLSYVDCDPDDHHDQEARHRFCLADRKSGDLIGDVFPILSLLRISGGSILSESKPFSGCCFIFCNGEVRAQKCRCPKFFGHRMMEFKTAILK